MPLLFAGITMLGCGSSLPRAPTYPTQSQTAEAPDDRPGMDDSAPLPLTLYPGDLVTITTVSNETTSLEHIVVDEAGHVHIPLVGDVEVGGQDLSEAEARLEEATRRFDRFARVSIDVTEAAGHRATVLGAVATPGEVSIDPGDRISDLVASAGGPRIEVLTTGAQVPLADLENATVYRDGHVLPIRVSRAMEGDPRHDVRARPGDRVQVPFTEGRVSVVGSVQGAGSFRLHGGMRFTEALSLAGGPDEHADRNDIRLMRGGPETPQVFRVSLDELSSGVGSDPVLAPGDVLVVHESDGVVVARVMAVLGPILAAATAVTVGIILAETR